VRGRAPSPTSTTHRRRRVGAAVCLACGVAVRLKFFGTQQQFASAVFSNDYRFMLFGGAIRGGKSYVIIGLIIALARMFPGSRWAIVRKDLPTLRRNTIPTFNKLAPRPFCSEVNQGTWSVRCANGSEILFFPESLKQDPDLDRWKGLEVNGFAFEEINECAEQTHNKAIERAGTWTADCEKQPPPYILASCNPARNWVKRVFYDPWAADKLKAPYYFMPSRVTDNPHLTADYLQSLEYLKAKDPAAYKRFVEGDWNVEDDETQLVQWAWLLNALNVDHIEGPKALGVDVARFGKDSSTIAHRDGNRLHRIEVHEKMPTDIVADMVWLRMTEGGVGAAAIKVDTVGLGAGVADNLNKMLRAGCTSSAPPKVTEVVGGARPLHRADSFYTYTNLRTQLWWEAREALRLGEELIDIPDGPRRQQLFEDLTAPRYSISGDKCIQVESKDETKKRLGRSPDLGDAFVYARADMVADGITHELQMF